MLKKIITHAVKVHREVKVKHFTKQAIAKYEKALRKLAYH